MVDPAAGSFIVEQIAHELGRRFIGCDIAVADSSEEFRYVLHHDVARFTAEGWEPLPALEGTHHGEYSVLMRRRGA